MERQTGSTIKPIGAYALGIEYGLVNWSTMLNNSPLYQKQDMIIRDEDYCRKNGLMGLSDKQLRAYPNAWRSWPRNYGGNYGDGSDLPLWNGLARSLNTIAIRVGDLVGASNIFNFVYNTLQLNTLDPTNDVGLACKLHKKSVSNLLCAKGPRRWPLPSRSSMTASTPPRTCTPVCWTGTATSTWRTTPPAIRP